jgi:hypothetical protein
MITACAKVSNKIMQYQHLIFIFGQNLLQHSLLKALVLYPQVPIIPSQIRLSCFNSSPLPGDADLGFFSPHSADTATLMVTSVPAI